MSIDDLYNALKSGDISAENALFRKLHEAFLFFVRHKIWNQEDVEEVVQETLLTISEKYKNIEFESSFSAWAYRLLQFKLMNYYRSKRSRRKLLKGAAQRWRDAPVIDPEEPVLIRKLAECLKKVNAVNHRYARILNLKYQGFSTGEISAKLETTPSNVYNILSRARSLLKLCLEKEDIRT